MANSGILTTMGARVAGGVGEGLVLVPEVYAQTKGNTEAGLAAFALGVGTSLVTVDGSYQFTNLVPGTYYIRLTPPADLSRSSGVPVNLDNRIDNDNNGVQLAGPGSIIISPLISLQPGAEPLNGSTDSTVDFGLFSGFNVGSHVFNDANNKGVFEPGSVSGVSAVAVMASAPEHGEPPASHVEPPWDTSSRPAGSTSRTTA